MPKHQRPRCGLDPAPLIAVADTRQLSARALADLIGTSKRTVMRYRGGYTTLDTWRADRAAIALGLHPANLWPEWSRR